jgi:integrase
MKRHKLPVRWAYKHGAFYYRPRPDEKAMFEGKSWYRLADNYPDALVAYAAFRRIEMADTVASIIDRYRVEILPLLRPATQDAYSRILVRLRDVLGHNQPGAITPYLVYQYRDLMISKGKSMNTVNSDVKVLTAVLDRAVQWGAVPANAIKGNVKAFGKRDGLQVERTRYVQDWELAEWQKVATPQQRAFAAIVMLTGARKGDVLRLRQSDVRDDVLVMAVSKTGRESQYRITPALRHAIELALEARHTQSLYLFCDKRGQCLIDDAGHAGNFDNAWKNSMTRAIKRTGLQESFTRHDLRAKVGSDADSEHRAQELLGHSNPAMTRKHYRRITPIIEPAG